MLETILQLATSWILPGLFFWAVMSLFAMAILEQVSSLLRWRGYFLRKGIREMLGEESLEKSFFEHPLILSTRDTRMIQGKPIPFQRVPQSIPSRIFAQVVLDWVLHAGKPGENGAFTASTLKSNLSSLIEQHPDLGGVLNVMFASAGIDRKDIPVDDVLLKAQLHIQNWFDDSMLEVTSWYKRRTMTMATVIGVVLAFMVNFDVIRITTQLWASANQGPMIQKAFEAQLDNMVLSADSEGNENSPLSLVNDISTLNGLNTLPIGWNEYKLPTSPRDWVIKLAGILAGGVIIAIGAQYGYELFSRKK